MSEEKKEQSYKTRGVAAPHNHMVYDRYLTSLSLDAADSQSLMMRGLSSKQIQIAKYGTKPTNRNKKIIAALADLRGDKINLEGVPGFYQDEKTSHWTQSGIFGIMIPVRDVFGNTSSLVVLNANPKTKAGKIQNKYVAFSSAGKPKGARVWQSTHCPIVKGAALEVTSCTIRITEGVLKADVATALGGIYTIGIQGLKVHDDIEVIIEKMEIDTVRVALDAGEDKNPDMIRAIGKLIVRLQDAGVDVIVERWDPKYGKGIDDVLKNGHFDKVRHATEEEIDIMIEDANEQNPQNGQWVYCIDAERFINIEDLSELKKSQFKDMFHLRAEQDVTDILADGFPTVRAKTYKPAADKFIYENGRKCINLWQDPKIKPIEGDITKFYEHLRYLFPCTKKELDEGETLSYEANIVLDWMAFCVQFPGEKINWALIIKGKEGVGKSAFQEIMGILLGKNNVTEVDNDQLHDKYTDFMKATSLIVIHEMMSRGRLDTMNKVKPLITQNTVQIREMYSSVYSQPNRANFLMFSNYDDSIIIDKNDRRYCVLWTDSELFEGEMEREYYGGLWEWIKSESAGPNLMFVLMKRDLKNFNAKGRAPATAAKKEAIKASMSQLEQWMSGCIEDNAWPFNGDIVNVRHLKEVCKNGCEKASDFRWAKALENCGATQHPIQVSLSDGSNVRLWVIRRAELHLNEGNYDEGVGVHLKKHYEAHSLDVEPGGNPLEDSKPM